MGAARVKAFERVQLPQAEPAATKGPSMARVTVEDCLEHEENRFALVVLAAQRARQLMKGAPALVHSKNRAAVTALREIAGTKVHFSRPVKDAVDIYITEQKALEK